MTPRQTTRDADVHAARSVPAKDATTAGDDPPARPPAPASLAVCDYAACTTTAVRDDDGWVFCQQHYAEHRADLHGAPWPKAPTVTVDQWAARGLKPCGTSAAARRHRRKGEQPCVACVEAEHRRRNPENPDGRRGSWYRPVAS